jgi:hypothetical protein
MHTNFFKVLLTRPMGNTPETFTKEQVDAMIAEKLKGSISQGQLNDILAEHKRTLQSQLAELTKKLEVGDPVALQAKIDELNNSLMTNEQKAKAEVEKARKAVETERDRFKQQSEVATGRFNELLIENEITKAAIAANAYDPKQMLMLLNKQAKVVENLDAQGKGLGTFKVLLPSAGEDGTVVDLATTDYVAKMREDKSFYNLFKVDGTPGSGMTLNVNGSAPSPNGKLPTNTDSYMEQRAANKKAGLV